MGIELHCPQCQKLIRAPDNAGGRRGKCPYCDASVYIPTPPDKTEEIGLAPIDNAEEKRARELRRESTGFAAAVGHTTDASDVGKALSEPAGGTTDVASEIEAFVIAMRDSQLDEADAVADRLKTSVAEARQTIRQMLADEQVPEVANVPPLVVQGFLKTLLGRLK